MKNNRLLYLLIIVLIIWNVILTVVLANKKESAINQTSVVETTVTGFSTDLTKVVEQVKSSVVTVETNTAVSSGFIYANKDNKVYIVTTYHGVNDSPILKVMFANGATYDAVLLGKDIYVDIAILEVTINSEVLPVKLGDSTLLKNGEFTVCIGTPKNIQYAFSNEIAIVSNNFRTITNSIISDDKQYEYYTNVIQLSSNVTDGYSGSPVLNMNGEVVGVITMKDGSAVFAMPINEVKYIADNIIASNEYNKIQFGFKGSFVSSLEGYEKNQLNIPLDINNGCYISAVKANSLANNIGLKPGDILVSINGTALDNYDDLLYLEYTENNAFILDVIRNNETLSLVGSIND